MEKENSERVLFGNDKEKRKKPFTHIYNETDC